MQNKKQAETKGDGPQGGCGKRKGGEGADAYWKQSPSGGAEPVVSESLAFPVVPDNGWVGIPYMHI